MSCPIETREIADDHVDESLFRRVVLRSSYQAFEVVELFCRRIARWTRPYKANMLTICSSYEPMDM